MNIYGGYHLSLRDKVRVWYFCIALTMLCALSDNIGLDAVIFANFILAAWQVKKADIKDLDEEEES